MILQISKCQIINRTNIHYLIPNFCQLALSSHINFNCTIFRIKGFVFISFISIFFLCWRSTLFFFFFLLSIFYRSALIILSKHTIHYRSIRESIIHCNFRDCLRSCHQILCCKIDSHPIYKLCKFHSSLLLK